MRRSLQRRNRAAVMMVGGALLACAGILIGLRGCGDRAGADDEEVVGEFGNGGTNTEAGAPGPERRRATGRMTVEQARKRVDSLLAVEAGEIAVIRIPAAEFDRSFSFPNSFPDSDGEVLPFSILSLESCRERLEEILRSGGVLSGALAKTDTRVNISGNEARVRVDVEDAERVSDLSLMISDSEENTLLRTAITVFKGSPLLFRPDALRSEGMLLLVGDDESGG